MGTAVRVFLNKKSGKGEVTPEQIVALFAAHECPCTITRLRKSLDAHELAKSDPAETIFIAAGGDGTVNLVAAAVAGTSRSMGVLPVGTLNHFARDLGLPLDLVAAVAAIAQGHTRRVDAAQANDSIFVNNSSLGTYPEMVVDRERMKKSGRNKWASLVVASFKAFVRFRCLTVMVEVDGSTRQCTTPFLFVGNNEYCLDGSRMGSRECVDGGRLSLYLAPGGTRATMLKFSVAAVLGRLKQLPGFEELQPREFQVTTRRRRLRVSLDGEVRHLGAPITYRILPGALRVVVPEVAA